MARQTRNATNRKSSSVNFSAILAIIVGIIIIAFPAVLAWAVGIYLIIMGVLDLLRR